MKLRIDSPVRFWPHRNTIVKAAFVFLAFAFASALSCQARASAETRAMHATGAEPNGKQIVDLFQTQPESDSKHLSAPGIVDNARLHISLQLQPMFAMKAGDLARIFVPSGVSYDVVHERIENGYGDGKVWVGYLAEYGKSYPVFISVYQGKLSGTIATPQGQHRLQGDVDGADLIDRRAANEPAFTPDRDDIAISPPDSSNPNRAEKNEDAASAIRLVTTASSAATAGNPAQIDMLYLYTPGFSEVLGGENAVIARINMLVATSNTVYANSAIYVNLHVIAASVYNYPDNDKTSTQAALDAIYGSQTILSLRSTVGADLIQMLRVYTNAPVAGTVCGFAKLSAAVSVVDDVNFQGYAACDGGFSSAGDTAPTHEIGHNMGASHDLYTQSVNPQGSGEPAYNRGYCNGSAGTVMAYSYTKTSTGDSYVSGCRPIVPYFSNPALLTECGGGACGVPIGTSYTAFGSSYKATGADSATAINANAPALAALQTVPATPRYLVGVNAGSGGSVSPPTPQAVVAGGIASFTVIPNGGYSAQVVGCGGTLSGKTYTTAPINAGCTVTVSFPVNTYVVSAFADSNGAIGLMDAGVQLGAVPYGTKLNFNVMPNSGYRVSSVSGCGGTISGSTLSGPIYTTAPITGSCAVAATFSLNTYAVTTNVSANGTLTLTDAGTNLASVPYGATLHFTVAPKAGYSANVTGCGGGLVANSYITAPITASCNITAQFTVSSSPSINLNQHGLTGSWGRSGVSGTRQGFLFNFYPDNVASGHGTVFAGWYTYDVASGSGGQRWYALQGDVYSNSASASLGIYTATDGNLNSGSKPANGQVGTATLSFSDCSTGMLVYAFNDGRSGSIPLSRVTHSVATCGASGDTGSNPQNYLLSGTWVVANAVGMGFVFDVSPADKTLLGSWYTFFPAGNPAPSPRQQWFVFQDSNFGPTATSSSNIDLLQSSGGTFDAAVGGGVTTTKVGSVSLSFTNCTTATFTYAIPTESVSQNTVNLVRLGPAPAGCTLP